MSARYCFSQFKKVKYAGFGRPAWYCPVACATAQVESELLPIPVPTLTRHKDRGPETDLGEKDLILEHAPEGLLKSTDTLYYLTAHQDTTVPGVWASFRKKRLSNVGGPTRVLGWTPSFRLKSRWRSSGFPVQLYQYE